MQEALVAQFARRNDAQAVSQRLNNILTYIQENYDLVHISPPPSFSSACIVRRVCSHPVSPALHDR